MGYWENCEITADNAVKTISRMIPKTPVKVSGILHACPTCKVGVFVNAESCKWCKQILKWDKDLHEVIV